MPNTFSTSVREAALHASEGYCQCSPDCVERATEFHHKLANTIVNRKLYKLFLQSVFNCCPIAHGCHMTQPVPRIREKQAQAYESYLMEFRDRILGGRG